MTRLTKVDEEGYYIDDPSVIWDEKRRGPEITRLGEFENLGYEPWDMKLILQKLDRGLLIETPCKIGSTVYRVTPRNRLIRHITEATVSAIHISQLDNGSLSIKESYLTLSKSGGYYARIPMSQIGKTVFSTREEAEIELNAE